MKAAVAPPIREKDLREQIRSLVKIYGWRMAFTQYSLRSPKGFPDLVLVRAPRLIFAELKSEVGKTTPEQDAWLADLRRVEHNVAVAAEAFAVLGAEALQEMPERTAEDNDRTIDHWRETGPLVSVEVYLWRPHDIEQIAAILGSR